MACAHVVRLLVIALLLPSAMGYPTSACCPAPHLGDWVINANQTVIMIWDPIAKRQHFIRQASFESLAKDFGFLIPSPTQPELAESGNAAFGKLHDLTAPKLVSRPRRRAGGCNVACSQTKEAMYVAAEAVRVLEEKVVAGFQASVLEADDVDALVNWLKEHDYAYLPAVAEWARPYVEQGWKITALKVATESGETTAPPGAKTTVDAKALRLSFDTDRPLFPYREPDYAELAGDNAERRQDLVSAQRMLRIYFLSNAKYQGELTKEQPWTGHIAWAGKLESDQRKELLDQLQLPEGTGPAEFYLTEFEDRWPYKAAPADVYFAAANQQDDVRRPDVYVEYGFDGDISLAMLLVLACIPMLRRRKRA